MSARDKPSSRVPVAQAAAIVILTIFVGILCIFACGLAGFAGGWLTRPASSSFPPTAESVAPPAARATQTVVPSPTPQPLPTSTLPPTPASGGVPPGEAAQASGMSIVVDGITRPADDIVTGASDFNAQADPGHEYMFVDVTITCLRSETADPCIFSPLINFTLIGARVGYTPEILLFDVPGLLEGGEVPPGRSVSGAMAFEINQKESDLTLMYQTILGSERAFLAVP